MTKKILLALLIILSIQLTASEKTLTSIDSLNALITAQTPEIEQAKLHDQIAKELLFNEPGKAYEHILQTICIAENHSDTALLYEGYITMSNFFSVMTNYESSLEYIYKAFDVSQHSKPLTAFCHSRLSELFYFINDLDQSIYHARQALSLHTKLHDSIQMTYDYHNIASWHLEFNHFDSALFYLHSALAVYAQISERTNPVFISQLGQTHSYLNQFDSALYYHFEALRLDTEDNSKYDIAIDKSYIGNTYFRNKEYNKAIVYANKSLVLAKEINLIDVILYNYELLYEAYNGKKEYKKALEYALLSNDYADSLRDKNKESIIQGLNAKFSFDEQQQKLQAQKAENTLLKRQKMLLIILSVIGLLFLISTIIIIIQIYQKHRSNKILLIKLEDANNAKERMISIISHDLRGSIGTLRNSLQYIIDASLDFKVIKKLLVSFFPVVDSTYDLLNNLLTWAKYNKESMKPYFEKIEIAPIIEKSIRHTIHLAENKNIEIVNKIKNTIVIADKNMLSTIVRNLISNAVKFSNSKSKVTISSAEINKNTEITITDEGVGIEPKMLEKLFTSSTDYHSKGTQGEGGSGLGLSLCKTFIEKQGGRIRVKSQVNKGSQFSFTIPVSQNN